MVGAMVILLLLTLIVGSVNADLGNTFLEIFALSVAAIVLQTLLDMGLIAFTLHAGDDIETVELSDLWHPQSFWSFIVSSFITGVCIVLGLFLFIIPGIILGLAWSMVKFVVIDRDMGPVDAIRESMRITKGNRFELLVLALLALGLNIIGALCLVVGLFVTVPVTSLAVTHPCKVNCLVVQPLLDSPMPHTVH
jgi:uncharacterized membrane protein